MVDEALVQVGHEEIHNARDLVERERLEEDDLVDAVQELGAEGLADLGITLSRTLSGIVSPVTPSRR